MRCTRDSPAKHKKAVLENGFLSLSLDDRAEQANKVFYVGKRGATIDLSFVAHSDVEVLVHWPSKTGKSFVSYKASIVSLPESPRNVSDKGDSG